MLTFPTYRGMNGLGAVDPMTPVPPPGLTCPEGQSPFPTYVAGPDNNYNTAEWSCKPTLRQDNFLPNSGCSWYQQPAAVQDMPDKTKCEFSPIRAFQAPALALLSPLSVLGFGGPHNALTDSLAAPLDEANHGKLNPLVLYTSDAADDMQCVNHGGRRISKKTKAKTQNDASTLKINNNYNRSGSQHDHTTLALIQAITNAVYL